MNSQNLNDAQMRAALEELQRQLGSSISLDLADREPFASDFGRWRHRTPSAVARCRNAAELAVAIRFCSERGIPVAPRSQGHTQSGQSTTRGLLLDSSAMNRILEINEDELYADVECGVIWRDLVIAATERGLLPPVLTNNLGVTVAGTTSMAGLGVASFRYGTQADNAIELEVVTGAGEVVVCSREKEPELFDMVRCSLGQIAMITRVRTRLRRAPSMVRMYTLVYDELGRFMEDALQVMHAADGPLTAIASMGGICSPAPLGFRKIGDGLELGKGMIGFAQWLFPMFLTVEFEPGNEPDDERVLAELSPWKRSLIQDVSQLEFCRRMEPMFEAWKLSGYWEKPHPWMETTLPWDTAKDYIETILANLPPGALGAGGHVLLWPAKTSTSDVPLFMHPGGEQVLGWGILGAVPEEKLEEMLTQLDMASELSIAFGGKRYLSGFITFDTVERWAAHYGDQWPRLCAAKQRWDPAGILAPGFIQYE